MSKKISVVITCYNLEKYISRAINSCINQTLSDEKYEIIIVDDASDDNSWDIISGYHNMGGLIKSIQLGENSGVSTASNKGISMSEGKYIVRVDGDDFINKNFLLTMSQILDWNEDIGFVYCDQIVTSEADDRKQEINTLDRLLDNGAGVMFRRRYLDVIGCYNEKLRNREDYDLMIRYMKNFDGYHLRLPYYRYFKRAGSLTSNVLAREEIKQELDRINNVSN